MQDEVAFLQKDADSNDKNDKIVNPSGKEQCHHYRKKDGHCINECPYISPYNREHIKKDWTERWENKNGFNHTQIGEVVAVTDSELEVEYGLSMLVEGEST